MFNIPSTFYGLLQGGTNRVYDACSWLYGSFDRITGIFAESLGRKIEEGSETYSVKFKAKDIPGILTRTKNWVVLRVRPYTSRIPFPVWVNTFVGGFIGGIQSTLSRGMGLGVLRATFNGSVSWGLSSLIAEKLTSTGPWGYGLATSVATLILKGVPALIAWGWAGIPVATSELFWEATRDGMLCSAVSLISMSAQWTMGRVKKGVIKGITASEKDPAKTYQDIQKNADIEKIQPEVIANHETHIDLESLKAKKEIFVNLLVDYLTTASIKGSFVRYLAKPIIHFVIKKCVINISDELFNRLFLYLENHQGQHLDNLRTTFIQELANYTITLARAYQDLIVSSEPKSKEINDINLAKKSNSVNYAKGLCTFVTILSGSPMLGWIAKKIFPNKKIQKMIDDILQSAATKDQIAIATEDILRTIMQKIPRSLSIEQDASKNPPKNGDTLPTPSPLTDEERMLSTAIQSFFTAISLAGFKTVGELQAFSSQPPPKDAAINASLGPICNQIAISVAPLLRDAFTEENLEKGLSCGLDIMSNILREQQKKVPQVAISPAEETLDTTPPRIPPTQQSLEDLLSSIVRNLARMGIEFCLEQTPGIHALLSTPVGKLMHELSGPLLTAAGFEHIAKEPARQVFVEEKEKFQKTLTPILNKIISNKNASTELKTTASFLKDKLDSDWNSVKGSVESLLSLLEQQNGHTYQEINCYLETRNRANENIQKGAEKIPTDWSATQTKAEAWLSEFNKQNPVPANDIVTLHHQWETLKKAEEKADKVATLKDALTRTITDWISTLQSSSPTSTSMLTSVNDMATQCIENIKQIKSLELNATDELDLIAMHTQIATHLEILQNHSEHYDLLDKMHKAVDKAPQLHLLLQKRNQLFDFLKNLNSLSLSDRCASLVALNAEEALQKADLGTITTWANSELKKCQELLNNRSPLLSPEDSTAIREQYQNNPTVQDTLTSLDRWEKLCRALDEAVTDAMRAEMNDFLINIGAMDDLHQMALSTNITDEQLSTWVQEKTPGWIVDQLMQCMTVLQTNASSLREQEKRERSDKLNTFATTMKTDIPAPYSQSKVIVLDLTKQCVDTIAHRALGVFNVIHNTIAIRLGVDLFTKATNSFLEDDTLPLWQKRSENVGLPYYPL